MRNRQCTRCDAKEPETEIYDIKISIDAPREYYCKECLYNS